MGDIITVEDYQKVIAEMSAYIAERNCYVESLENERRRHIQLIEVLKGTINNMLQYTITA